MAAHAANTNVFAEHVQAWMCVCVCVCVCVRERERERERERQNEMLMA